MVIVSFLNQRAKLLFYLSNFGGSDFSIKVKLKAYVIQRVSGCPSSSHWFLGPTQTLLDSCLSPIHLPRVNGLH